MNKKYFSMKTLTASLIMLSLMIVHMFKEKTIMMEWSMMKFMSTDFKIMFTMDSKSTSFAACVMLITSSVILYSNYYMKTSKKSTTFTKLIMIFITSMMIFIFSSNMISMILGWEGLGMSSFILIMFYQNKKSLNSSFYTMMMNRMGDIMMMMGMINMMNISSWQYTSTTFTEQMMMNYMILIAAFSKSAQMPFSSWLTEAMAAPTPISALVHSSTLVTAGVFLFIRMETMLKYKKMMTTILMISMSTLIMTSMNSLMEWDIKKIVALSTLSQLSIMFITISMNLFNLAMFHLLVHATFKALIFLCSSTFISLANTQDIRNMNKLSKHMKTTKMAFNTATMSLCGFPMMSSFFSKEMIMEMTLIKKSNIMMITIFYLCMAATLIYSMKMMVFMNLMKNKKTMVPNKELTEQKTSKIMLIIPSVMYGNKMNWMMNMNFKIPMLTKELKLVPSMMILMAMLTITYYNNLKMNTIKSQKTWATGISYMWFMKNLSIQTKKIFLSQFYKTMKNNEKTIFHKMMETTKKTFKIPTFNNFKMTHMNSKKMNIMMITALLILL